MARTNLLKFVQCWIFWSPHGRQHITLTGKYVSMNLWLHSRAGQVRWFISSKSLIINGGCRRGSWPIQEPHTATISNIYSGKRADNVDSGVGVTHATVMRMVQPCIDRGHHIYFDNYYKSPSVLKELSSKGFRVCGTLRVNRKDVPPTDHLSLSTTIFCHCQQTSSVAVNKLVNCRRSLNQSNSNKPSFQ